MRELSKYYLGGEVNPDWPDIYGTTLLLFPAVEIHEAVVELLLR